MNETTTYQQLHLTERLHIERWRHEGVSLRGMARRLGRSPSTRSRELKRNGSEDTYTAAVAQSTRQQRRTLDRPLPKLHADSVRWDVVTELLHWRWSPQQIAATLRWTFPQDPSRQVSHETLYTAIYAQPRGELRRELIVTCRDIFGPADS